MLSSGLLVYIQGKTEPEEDLVTCKTFVIDTNVLLHDPEAITKFPKQNLVIPVTVLEELDRKKRTPGELGRNAREVFRFLDSLKKAGAGNLHDGVQLENGAKVRIQMEIKRDYSATFSLNPNDNRIIMAAYLLLEKGERVVFLSKDFAARIKAEALGLESEDYENLKYSLKNIYRGVRSIEVTKNDVDRFHKDGALVLEEMDFSPNEYCVLNSPEKSSAVAKYNQEKKRLEPLLAEVNTWGIQPRNIEQRCAIDLLLRDDIKLVTLMGPAGTGKTLLALACALRKVFDEGSYRRLLISRPIVPLGRDIGYLPGTKEEKLFHWMQPIHDNLEFLCEVSGEKGKGMASETARWVLDSGKIEMEAVTYIRGRTLPKSFFIIDEAQNLTPHEVKTVISRAGEGTKVILTGDPYQIDNPYLDQDSNALTYTTGRFIDYNLYGHIFLEKTERSELAAIAAEVL